MTTMLSAKRSASSRYWVVSKRWSQLDESLDHPPQVDPAPRVEAGRGLIEEQDRTVVTKAAARSKRRRMPPE